MPPKAKPIYSVLWYIVYRDTVYIDGRPMRCQSTLSATFIRYSMKSVTNTLSIIELIAAHQPCSLADLSARSGLPKTTVQRSIATLKDFGWIHPHSLTGKPKWLLSSHLMSLLKPNDALEKLQAIAKPHLQQLRDLSNESVFLSKFENTGMVVIDYLESHQVVKTAATIGVSAPLHASSTGKSCLSLLDENTLKKLLKKNLAGFTDKTITDVEKICSELKGIRKLGYAVSKGEWMEEICNIGSVITNAQGQPIAGLGITIPTFRFTAVDKEKVGVSVREACREISALLVNRRCLEHIR